MNLDFIESEDTRGQVETLLKTEIATAITTAKETLEKELKGTSKAEISKLLNKNEELIGEKKKIQEILKNFDGIDPEKAKDALSFLNENEDALLLKEGKFEELIDKKTSKIKSDYEDRITALTGKTVDAEDRASNSESKYAVKVVRDTVRDEAIQAGVRLEALPDILYRADSIFSMAGDESVEARDKNDNLIKIEDDLILTPALWIESLKKVAPHFWPPSKGAGNTGISSGSMTDLETALADAANRNDMKAFRKIRAKMEGTEE